MHQFDVFVISGGKFELFEKQVIGWPEVDAAHLRRLHLMPTCSTRYYRIDTVEVTRWEDTAVALEAILSVVK